MPFGFIPDLAFGFAGIPISMHCERETVRCHAMIVDAKDEALKTFYSKYGFKALPDHQLRLYLPIATLAKLSPS
jgi:hypothetical protein